MTKRIVFQDTDGGVAVVVPAPGATIADCMAAVPQGAASVVVDVADIPQDRVFRKAWVFDAVKGCKEDVTKAKAICHDKRRAAREAEFAPHDAVIMKQVPGTDAVTAETARVAIRAKYAAIQQQIDSAGSAAALRVILGGL